MGKKESRDSNEGTARRQCGPRRVGGREQAHLGRNQVCRRGEVRTPDLELEKCDVFPMERNVWIANTWRQDREQVNNNRWPSLRVNREQVRQGAGFSAPLSLFPAHPSPPGVCCCSGGGRKWFQWAYVDFNWLQPCVQGGESHHERTSSVGLHRHWAV